MNLKQPTGCLRYWDQCSTVSLDAAIALWCNVEPGELKGLGFSTSCMDAKREAIIDALRDKRLDYEDRGVKRDDGKGYWDGAGITELIRKDGLRITKVSLRRWFLDMPSGDKPPFLFDESRREKLPDGGEISDMNTNKALAIMAWLLSENRPAMQIGGKPNAAQIGEAVAVMARKVFGQDVRGFEAFHKKISKALKLLSEENSSDIPF
jgi:hypothetical protein